MKNKYYVNDLNGDEHQVEVDYDEIVSSEDEGYAEITTVWSINDDKELLENDITPKSFSKLQEELDELVMDQAHELYYEKCMSDAYDRAKDSSKYGD